MAVDQKSCHCADADGDGGAGRAAFHVCHGAAGDVFAVSGPGVGDCGLIATASIIAKIPVVGESVTVRIGCSRVKVTAGSVRSLLAPGLSLTARGRVPESGAG